MMNWKLVEMITNVILITIDCLISDRLGYNGYHKKLTTNMDEIAKNGSNFF